MSGLIFLVLPSALLRAGTMTRKAGAGCGIEFGGSCIIDHTNPDPPVCTEKLCDIQVPPDFCPIVQ